MAVLASALHNCTIMYVVLVIVQFSSAYVFELRLGRFQYSCPIKFPKLFSYTLGCTNMPIAMYTHIKSKTQVLAKAEICPSNPPSNTWCNLY